MKKLSLLLGVSLLLVCGISSTLLAQTEEKGLLTNPNGLKYRYFRQADPNGMKAKATDMVTLSVFFKTKDTIIFDSRKYPNPYTVPVLESTYKGDYYEALKMLAVGDSAQFVFNGDSLFFKTFQVKKLPPYIKPGGTVSMFVKMIQITSREDYQKELHAKMEAKARESALLKAREDSTLSVYLKKNEIKVEPTKSGLYFLETYHGPGAIPQTGDTVIMQYTGKLLDGRKFDSSIDRGKPFSFVLGKGKVIPGWDEGVAKMTRGTKATLIIPSKLGYGEKGFGSVIPPFSVLVFDVELLDIK